LRCVYLLIDAGDHPALEAAQKHGFLVRDIRVEMGRSVAGHRATNEGLRRGRLDDLPELQAIVDVGFRGGRFFTDGGFPRERSTDLYMEWVRKGLACEPGWAAIVTDDQSGFVVVTVNPQATVGTVVLIGVSQTCMGKGIGSILMAGAGKYFVDNSLLHARVVTQGHNVAALRLYQSHGYHVVGMRLWLHRWR
jgi:ribosomal protein S18 acetylase RimI-like enzyme